MGIYVFQWIHDSLVYNNASIYDHGQPDFGYMVLSDASIW